MQERKFHDWATFPGGRTKAKTQNAKNKEIRENWNFKLTSIVIAGELNIQFHMREEQKSPLDTSHERKQNRNDFRRYPHEEWRDFLGDRRRGDLNERHTMTPKSTVSEKSAENLNKHKKKISSISLWRFCLSLREERSFPCDFSITFSRNFITFTLSAHALVDQLTFLHIPTSFLYPFHGFNSTLSTILSAFLPHKLFVAIIRFNFTVSRETSFCEGALAHSEHDSQLYTRGNG